MKQCPRCDATLPDQSTACRCGWRDRKQDTHESRPPLPCAHEECREPALVNIKTQTGMALLCRSHYDQHYKQKALDTCSKLGLHTTEQRREWAKAQLRANPLFRNLEKLYQTEPGEDWDEPTLLDPQSPVTPSSAQADTNPSTQPQQRILTHPDKPQTHDRGTRKD